MIGYEDIFDIARKASIIDVCKAYSIDLNSNNKCLCPIPTHIHKNYTPSFSVDQEKNIFSCFGQCNIRGGDAIKLVSLLENVSLTEAATIILKSNYSTVMVKKTQIYNFDYITHFYRAKNEFIKDNPNSINFANKIADRFNQYKPKQGKEKEYAIFFIKNLVDYEKNKIFCYDGIEYNKQTDLFINKMYISLFDNQYEPGRIKSCSDNILIHLPLSSTKEKAKQWCPAVFNTPINNNYNLSKSKKNIHRIYAFVLDCDQGYNINNCIAYFKRENITSIFHTTHSHTKENHRFRVIIPFSRGIDITEFELAKYYLIRLCKMFNADMSSCYPTQIWKCPPDVCFIDNVIGNKIKIEKIIIEGSK